MELLTEKSATHPEIPKNANAENGFVGLGRDVHCIVLSLLSIQDALRLAATCQILWTKLQPQIVRKILGEEFTHNTAAGMSYLSDVIEFSTLFGRSRINYKHLAILFQGKSILEPIIKSDPRCEWKIAAICGDDEQSAQLLGTEVATIRDQFFRGKMHYNALGNQVGCLRRHLHTFYPPENSEQENDDSEDKIGSVQELEIIDPSVDERTLTRFCQAKNDPSRSLAVMAALGGAVKTLAYLRDQLGYDLVTPLAERSPEGFEETLLTYAAVGGHEEALNFLEAAGVPHSRDRNLAFCAVPNGHWALYEKLSQRQNPILNLTDAIYVAGFAARNGNLSLTLRLMNEHQIPPEKLKRDVVDGGCAEVVWHFVEQKWLALTDTFGRGEPITHLLAQEGHLPLLQEVLKKIPLDKGFFALDNEGQSILFYAAAGGHFHVHCFLERFEAEVQKRMESQRQPKPFYSKNMSLVNKLARRDHQQRTTAHIAAEEGMVWFLMHCQQSNPALLQEVDCFGNSILHSAANSGDPYLLFMIIDKIGIDILTTNATGENVLHILCKLAADRSYYWNTIWFLADRYGTELLDDTIRQAIQDNQAEAYFPEEWLSEKNSKLF